MKELPDRWCVERNVKSCTTLNDYFNKGCKSKVYTSEAGGWFFHYPDFNDNNGFSVGQHLDDIIRQGYTEISFEDFQRLVLVINVEKGYELW